MSVVVNPFIYGTVGGGSLATFVGSSTGQDQIQLPAETVVGDLALVYVSAEATTLINGAGGWTRIDLGSTNTDVHWKIVASGDIGGAALTPDPDPGDFMSIVSMVFRNTTSVALKSVGTNSPTNSLELAGFVKNGSHKGVAGFAISYDDASVTGPTGFINTSEMPGTNGTIQGAYLINGSYVNNTTLTWTFGGVGAVGGCILELL